MPIYEYQCADCQRRVSLLVRRISTAEAPRCSRCGSERLTRLMSRFSTIRSEEDRLESLADPGRLGDLDENDPESVRRWTKKMGGELGEEGWDDMVDEAYDEEMKAEGQAGEHAGGDDDL